MTNLQQIYKCEVCGNIVEVLHTGQGELICCGQPMKLQSENTVDASQEKHVPIIENDEQGVIIKVGSDPHPMDDDHYIEWIEISTDKGESKKFLKPGDKPEASFPVKRDVKARAYCNLHGLWKSE
ncbi:desulfoferrodoxin [Candidatus Pacearchaeota archaeon]|nr:desulfoferrodoxin [Candidatus Pacearchaeota archaeon]